MVKWFIAGFLALPLAEIAVGTEVAATIGRGPGPVLTMMTTIRSALLSQRARYWPSAGFLTDIVCRSIKYDSNRRRPHVSHVADCSVREGVVL